MPNRNDRPRCDAVQLPGKKMWILWDFIENTKIQWFQRWFAKTYPRIDGVQIHRLHHLHQYYWAYFQSPVQHFDQIYTYNAMVLPRKNHQQRQHASPLEYNPTKDHAKNRFNLLKSNNSILFSLTMHAPSWLKRAPKGREAGCLKRQKRVGSSTWTCCALLIVHQFFRTE